MGNCILGTPDSVDAELEVQSSQTNTLNLAWAPISIVWSGKKPLFILYEGKYVASLSNLKCF